MEFLESLAIEQLQQQQPEEGRVQETYVTLTRFRIGSDDEASLTYPWGPLGVLLQNAVVRHALEIDASLGSTLPSTQQPLHLRFGFDGGRADSQCSEGLHLACLRLQEVFSKWFSPSLSRSVLHFHTTTERQERETEEEEEEEEEGKGEVKRKRKRKLYVDAWLGQEDLPMTAEALSTFLSLSYPLGKDLGLSSVLHHDLEGLLKRVKRYRFYISLTDTSSGHKIYEEKNKNENSPREKPKRGFIAEVRTELEVDAEADFHAHAPSSPVSLEELAKRWKEAIDQKMTKRWLSNSSACARSTLFVRSSGSADDSPQVWEIDLKGTSSDAGKGGWLVREDQDQSLQGGLISAKRYLTGHPSSLYVVENYELIYRRQERERERPLSTCILDYVPLYLSPLFSASTVQKLENNRQDNTQEGGGEEASEASVDADDRNRAWSLAELRPSITYTLSEPSGSAHVHGHGMCHEANLMQICMDLAPLSLHHSDVKAHTEEVYQLSLAFRKSFPAVFDLPADRSSGLYLPASYIYSNEPSPEDAGLESMASLLHGSASHARGETFIYRLPSQRLLYPLPDASMPYNVCIITCTLFALYVGVLLKALRYIPKLKPQEERNKKSRDRFKRVKTLVNVSVLFVLAGVVWLIDSETRYKIIELL